MTRLNSELLKAQGVTEQQEKDLGKAYNELKQLFVYTASLDPERRKAEGKQIANVLQQLEFNLQRLWNFPEDANYHTYWNKLEGCTCPMLDNEERFGTYKIVSCDCPYHGNCK